jgi:hypothetical protein
VGIDPRLGATGEGALGPGDQFSRIGHIGGQQVLRGQQAQRGPNARRAAQEMALDAEAAQFLQRVEHLLRSTLGRDRQAQPLAQHTDRFDNRAAVGAFGQG